MADPTQELDVVALEAHPRPATEAEAAARQLVTDLLDGDLEAGGQALDDHREGRAVRFAGGQIAQHTPRLPG